MKELTGKNRVPLESEFVIQIHDRPQWCSLSPLDSKLANVNVLGTDYLCMSSLTLKAIYSGSECVLMRSKQSNPNYPISAFIKTVSVSFITVQP
jgi:hypothetical protein